MPLADKIMSDVLNKKANLAVTRSEVSSEVLSLQSLRVWDTCVAHNKSVTHQMSAQRQGIPLFGSELNSNADLARDRACMRVGTCMSARTKCVHMCSRPA